MRTTLSKTKKRQCSISFVGKYEATVLSDKRTILPSGVIRQLKDHDVEKVLLGRLPGFKALVLCPEILWDKWVSRIKKRFPCLSNHDGARSFLIPWQPISWDSRGRISLPRRARDYVGAKAYDAVTLVGTDFYFELWAEEEFTRITRECEIALRRSIQPLRSVGNGILPANDLKTH